MPKKGRLDTVADIFALSQNLPFQKVQHRVDTTDAQPSGDSGGIVVMVTGALMVSSIVFHSHSGCAMQAL